MKLIERAGDRERGEQKDTDREPEHTAKQARRSRAGYELLVRDTEDFEGQGVTPEVVDDLGPAVFRRAGEMSGEGFPLHQRYGLLWSSHVVAQSDVGRS